MIPSLREPPSAIGELGDRLPRKDELPPPPRPAEEISPGVWRGPDGKLFTQLEEPKAPPDPYEELADELLAKTSLVREPKIGDKIRILNPEANGFSEERKGQIAEIVALSWAYTNRRISVKLPTLDRLGYSNRFYLVKDPFKDRFGRPLESPSWEIAE